MQVLKLDGIDPPVGLALDGAQLKWEKRVTTYPANAHLVGCVVEVRRSINSNWTNVHFDRCVFRGEFIGDQFGAHPDGHGSLKKCDFSEAMLHGCSFWACDLREQILPKWPGFVVLSPRDNAPKILKARFPGELAGWVMVFQVRPRDVIAEAFNAKHMAMTKHVPMKKIERAVRRLSDIVIVEW